MPAKLPWPYSILAGRPERERVAVFDGPIWHGRHHIVASKGNTYLPKTTRGYFDTIPSIRRVAGDELDNQYMLQPLIGGDLKEHEERLHTRFEGFPFFRPSAAQIRKRALQNRAASPPSQATHHSAGDTSALLPCSTLMEAAKKGESTQQRTRAERKVNDLLKTRIVEMSKLKENAPMADFLKWADLNRLNLARIWQKLDIDRNMSVTRMEFLAGLRRLKYRGDLYKLWDSLDRDKSSVLSLYELAPEIAMDLARVKKWALDQFCGLDELFKALDADGSGKVSFVEFEKGAVQRGLPKRLHDSLNVLFEFLDDPDDHASRGTLTIDELKVLESLVCPLYFTETADIVSALNFHSAVVSLHGDNALAAWVKAFNGDRSMHVTFEEFTIACKTLAKQGVAEADPPCGSAAMYCAFDTDRSGHITLKEWDTEAHDCLYKFVTQAKQQSGKVSDFIRASAKEPSRGIGLAEFLMACKQKLGMKGAQARFVYQGLQGQRSSASHLLLGRFLFMDQWHPDVQQAQDVVWHDVMAGHRFTVMPSIGSLGAKVMASGQSSLGVEVSSESCAPVKQLR